MDLEDIPTKEQVDRARIFVPNLAHALLSNTEIRNSLVKAAAYSNEPLSGIVAQAAWVNAIACVWEEDRILDLIEAESE